MNNLNLTIKAIQFNTPEYFETLELRREILRKPLGLDYTKEQLASEFRDFHIAGYLEGKLVACLILTNLDGLNIKMRQVAVAQDMQGKGIGKQMIQFSEQFAKKRKFKNMVLHARETAIPFYLAQNYQILSDEFFLEVGIPHKKMFKQGL